MFPYMIGASIWRRSLISRRRTRCANVVIAQNADSVTVSFSLANTGDRDGAEVAQLYLRQEHALVVRPERQLIAFEKVFLKKGEKKVVTMKLSKDDFSYMDVNGIMKFEPSSYTLMLGASSQDIRLEKTINMD